jgi:hypothetical protein
MEAASHAFLRGYSVQLEIAPKKKQKISFTANIIVIL